jgi:hypothetical protein
MAAIQSDESNSRTSPRKRARKPNAETLRLWEAILTVAAEYERMSVRQLFYQLVSRGAIPKTEQAYKRVCDASNQMRIQGVLPYRKIADGHRVRHRVFVHDGIAGALASAHEMYRRNYWLDQDYHVEVWTEKDALSGIIRPICSQY